MITIIRGSLLHLFYYWKEPVTDRHGRSAQNGYFIGSLRPQDRFSLSSESYENEFQTENSRFTTNLHTTGIVQIPIALQHTVPPCLRPAVSSLGACPTPAL